MKVVVLLEGGVPNPQQSGSTLTVWTTVRWLLDAGHEVAVLVLIDGSSSGSSDLLETRLSRLRELGATAELLQSRAQTVFADLDARGTRVQRLWRPPDEQLLPNLLDAAQVRDAVSEQAPDVVYVYHWEALAASRQLDFPRFAAVVDLPQLSALYRWRATPGKLSRRGLSRLLWLQARLRRLPPLMVELLEECEGYANFAAHHAAWLRRRGAQRCAYMHIPIEDPVGAAWREHRDRVDRNGRPRLLLIGHLRGTSTLDGLTRFGEEVLPELERELGPDAFEVRIVGAHDPPPHLARLLARPSVRLLGVVEDVDAEFAAADVTVVPTSVALGTRVRILSAFSHGCPVVAHRANSTGIPELADERNVLLGNTGRELANGILRLLDDRLLARSLEQEGRETYERFFAPPAAAAALETALKEVARRRVDGATLARARRLG